MNTPIITIKNNTSLVVPISIGNSTAAPGDTINAFIDYSWNVCSLLYVNLTTVVIQARLASASQFTTYTADIQEQSLNGVIDALNSLGIGTFLSGGNSIVSINDEFVYGSLQINDSSASDTINFNWDFTFGTPVANYNLNVVNNTQSSFVYNAHIIPLGSIANQPGVAAGDVIQFEFVPISAGPFSGEVTLFKNGCLVQTKPFSGAGGGISVFIIVSYDRDEDVYQFSATVN